ncbi:MAG: lysophospholipid acyltransferase family protein [Bacteroidia bacterium]
MSKLMRELVSKSAFVKVAQLEKLRLSGAAKPLMRLSGIEQINRVYDRLHRLRGLDFVEGLIRTMEIEIEWDGKGLERIPTSGPFITISNHPFGLWDGLILLKLFAKIRPDYKVMADFLLQHVEPVGDLFIRATPGEGSAMPAGIDAVADHLAAGSPVGIFPAGEVSTFQRTSRQVTDPAWQRQILRLIQTAQVPVIPVYFEGSNSPFFHIMGMIHPSLRMAAIPQETLRKKKTKIRVRVGSPITVKEQQSVTGTDRLGRYLRARTYSLGSGLPVNRFFRPRFQFPVRQQAIAPETATHLIRREIEQLDPASLICAQGEFEVYCARAAHIPHALQEIGRLREITFREVGEGTGHACDTDEYDLYYHHLFLWDKDAGKIAGAYRMGPGDEIMLKYGKKGFYTHSLFKMQAAFEPYLHQAVELGRSFILTDYQRKRLPLFLLWKGIYTFLRQHEQYRYLIGPVSISNDYSPLSKSFIVAIIRRFYFDPTLASMIQPRKRFHPRLKHVDIDGLVEGIDGSDLKQVDRVLEEIEPAHFKLPVLLKKYIRQNARIIAFNVDPKFNHALDGFMIMDLKDLPEATAEGMER